MRLEESALQRFLEGSLPRARFSTSLFCFFDISRLSRESLGQGTGKKSRKGRRVEDANPEHKVYLQLGSVMVVVQACESSRLARNWVAVSGSAMTTKHASPQGS
ncbi:unnamed protein product [Symbiodinium natans]|uniref:Uncharacterized protein n=1 Tax=Symbiodinium natans TaxID=878477 RepID=A0A812TVN8_9DINO|nr:unnamed protein product [Symbiodinium natans]